MNKFNSSKKLSAVFRAFLVVLVASTTVLNGWVPLVQAAETGSESVGFVVPEPSFKGLPAITSPTYQVDMTAYTSSVEECDSDPFTTADGSHTHDGIIATNFLPFGTKVRVPALFGDKIFEVHDRMNEKYWHRIDIWMEKKPDMREFGIHHNVTVEIVEMGDGHTQWGKAKTVALKK